MYSDCLGDRSAKLGGQEGIDGQGALQQHMDRRKSMPEKKKDKRTKKRGFAVTEVYAKKVLRSQEVDEGASRWGRGGGVSNEDNDDHDHELPGRHFEHSNHDQHAESGDKDENSDKDETLRDEDERTMQRRVKCCSACQFLTKLATLDGPPLCGSPLGEMPHHHLPQMAQPDLVSQIVETK
ncbi:hypothetical protein DL96DRAFT_1566962 [Flagelloscypha sp. PMI_526]|nr:hypothetical protein DL96DRAFT_1566962 [Flagelloscypha sp. PMI_526]